MKFFETEFGVILDLNKIIYIELESNGIWATDITGKRHHIYDLSGSTFGDNQFQEIEFSDGLKLMFMNCFISSLIQSNNQDLIYLNEFDKNAWDIFLEKVDKMMK